MTDVSSMTWLNVPAALPCVDSKKRAQFRQTELTKPSGALGRLEDLAVLLASLQGTDRPSVEHVRITVFAADHGVAQEGISAFPQAVTAEMVKNFSRGGAAICVAARALGAELEVINLGTIIDTGPLVGVKNYTIGSGTENFTVRPAMSEHQLANALAAGRHAVERAHLDGAQLFIGGEMGIGNTTAATALACALLCANPEHLAGPGTGLDRAGIAHKARIIQRALDFHRGKIAVPEDALRRIGGFEIAALTGVYLAAAQMGMPVLVDGFICSVAALVAMHIQPAAKQWFLFSHVSAEPGHRLVLEALDAEPLLALGMRLGEGSGAAVTVPLLRMACALHNEMATFSQAAVSTKY